jgi:hypothetical protein
MRTTVLITGLLLLLAANLFMMYATPFGLTRMEGFEVKKEDGKLVAKEMDEKKKKEEADKKKKEEEMKKAASASKGKEGFASYSLADGAGARELYQPMGAFDGVVVSTGNASRWRYTSPNEPLRGPAFKPGPDELFIFKNNQCKPECCGASFSCGSGCVCTTPQQRDFINQRGGNRTAPEDGV